METQIVPALSEQMGELVGYSHRGATPLQVYLFPESGGNTTMRQTVGTRTQEDKRTFQIGAQPTNLENYTITNATWSSAGGGTAVLTIGTHDRNPGDTVFVTGNDPIGFDGTFYVTAVSSTTISYLLAVNPGSFTAGGNAQVTTNWPPLIDGDDTLCDDTITEGTNVYVVRQWSADSLNGVYTFPDCIFSQTLQAGMVGQ